MRILSLSTYLRKNGLNGTGLLINPQFMLTFHHLFPMMRQRTTTTIFLWIVLTSFASQTPPLDNLDGITNLQTNLHHPPPLDNNVRFVENKATVPWIIGLDLINHILLLFYPIIQLTPFEDANSSILGMPSIVHEPLWYPDSGATHHLTHDAQNLTQKCSYIGKDSIKLGNGVGISISSIGSICFTTPHTQSPFILHDLLYVPSIMINLLSVSKFA